MAFPRHDAYRDSGFDWLGNIPLKWDLKRLAVVFEERKEKVSDKDFPPLSVTKNGILPQLDSAAKSDDGDNRKGVRRGDFVINSRSDRKGSSGIAKQDGSVSLINIVLQPKGIAPQYCEYLLKSNGFIEEFYRNGHGIVADLWTTRFWDMKSIQIPLPDMRTQERIADVLDQKTAEIDEAIAKKQRLIELLTEQKAILINQAVTKGLNPDVPMRDSGVEWIGEVPEHWSFPQFGYCCAVIKDGLHHTPPKHQEGINFVSTQHVRHRQINTEGATFISIKAYKEGHPRIRPQVGDVLITLVGSIGFAALVKEIHMPLSFTRHVGYVRCIEQKLNQQYLINYTESHIFKCFIEKNVSQTAQPSIYLSSLAAHKLPLPPIDEQQKIVNWISMKTTPYDQAIAKAQGEIMKFGEFKQVLIAEAVTGKIKI